MLKNASTATKFFVFVAPLRFPRDPFLFPLPPEFSLVVRCRATQTQRKQTAAKATVVNEKKSDFSLKTSRKHTHQLHCNIFCQLETSSRRFCDWNKMFRSRTVSSSTGIIINNLISYHRKYITYGIGSFHFTWEKNPKYFVVNFEINGELNLKSVLKRVASKFKVLNCYLFNNVIET